MAQQLQALHRVALLRPAGVADYLTSFRRPPAFFFAPFQCPPMIFFSSDAAARIGLRRIVFAVLAVSLTTNALLAAALVAHRPETRTVIVPPTAAHEREFWSFDSRGPSAPYIERFALSLLSHAATVTPDTVDAARKAILLHADPAVYGELEEAFILEGERIKKEHASSAFFPNKARVDVDKLTVDVEGIQKLLVGSTVTSTRQKTWRMTFRYDAGRLFLTSLTDRTAEGSRKKR